MQFFALQFSVIDVGILHLHEYWRQQDSRDDKLLFDQYGGYGQISVQFCLGSMEGRN